MGIRFLCHHCKKRLNIKAKQAGQVGQCPHCKESLTVPLESTITSQSGKQQPVSHGQQRVGVELDSQISLQPVDEQATLDGIPAEQQQAAATRPTNVKQQAFSSEFDFHDSDESLGLFLLDKPGPPKTRGKIDPIAEAPDRIWYFRSRELGERGPLKAKAMQSHLDSGEVTIGCIVWREDWEDWAPAEKVFPSLVAEAKSRRKQARVKRAFKDARYQIPDELDPKSAFNRRQRRKKRIFAAAITGGIVLVLILIFVLINLLSH